MQMQLITQPRRIATYAARRVLKPASIRHFGVHLAVDREVLSPAVVESLYKGGYEAAEVQIIRATLSPEDRVLEIGGGIGFVGVIASQIVRRGHVLVVEANPHLVPVMEANFRLNGVAPTIWNAVLGREREKDVSFYVHRDFWASSLTAFPGAREVKVPQHDIRTVLAEFRPTYLIVDIEGGEIELFRDLPLRGVEKLCLEVHPNRTGQAAVDDLCAGLARQGFVMERSSPRGNVVFLRSAP